MKKRRDLIVIVFLLAIALALFLVQRLMGAGSADMVVARINGEEVLRTSLHGNGTYAIPQDEGNVNIIRVEDGAVWMEEANCRDGLCIGQGKMRNAAKSIVCLPHALVITLEGSSGTMDDDDLDVIIY